MHSENRYYLDENIFKPEKHNAIFIDDIWTGASPNLFPSTVNDLQVVAYYTPQHDIKVAARNLGEDEWHYKVLQKFSTGPWDNHASLVVGIAPDNTVHVSGRMHNTRLRYWRSKEPIFDAKDIVKMVRVTNMVDGSAAKERHVTYPRFYTMADGSFIYGYRNGSSRKGTYFYNTWNGHTFKWNRRTVLFDQPSEFEKDHYGYPYTSEAAYNASYSHLEQDGVFHIVWKYRLRLPDIFNDLEKKFIQRPLCYIFTEDYIHFYDLYGNILETPINSINAPTAIVDEVSQGGISAIGKAFLPDGRLVIVYSKNDENGIMNSYLAIIELGVGFSIHKMTNFSHQGSQYLVLGPVLTQKNGAIYAGLRSINKTSSKFDQSR